MRPGLVSEAPMIRLDPTPATVTEGTTTQLKVVASVSVGPLTWALTGSGVHAPTPLPFQWYALSSKV